jgi:hypothetical protein
MLPLEQEYRRKLSTVFDRIRGEMARAYAKDAQYDPTDRWLAGLGELQQAMRPPHYTLTDFTLCLPVNKAGEPSGLATYVDTAADFPPSIASPFVQVFSSSVVVTCPHRGAATKSLLDHPRTRTEFQERVGTPLTQRKRHTVAFAKQENKSLPDMAVGDEVVCGQLHCGDFPLVKMKLRRDAAGYTLLAFVKPVAKRGAADVVYTIARGIPADKAKLLTLDWFPAVSGVIAQQLFISFDGLPHTPITVEYPENLHLKATFGIYWQEEWKEGDSVKYATLEFFR